MHKIRKKIATNKIVILELFLFIKILNSNLNFLKTEKNIILILLGRDQNKGKEINKIKNVLIQLKDNIKNEEGSNDENKLVIIVNV